MKKFIQKIKAKVARVAIKTTAVLADKKGQGAFDTVVTVLISVVLGALLLGGLYVLFGDTVLPQLSDKISDMFNYAG